jgi:hypothetical protein
MCEIARLLLADWSKSHIPATSQDLVITERAIGESAFDNRQ